MSTSPALRRLKKEYMTLSQAPTPGILVAPKESNFLHCNFIFYGPVFHGTPYEGGVYHGVLTFPRDFPMKPPQIKVTTECGRFEPNAKICMSMSDFHPELWNPTWSVRSILVGMVSFWNSDEMTTGGVKSPRGEKVSCARESLDALCANADLVAMFPVLLEMQSERCLVGGGSWPPVRGKFDASVEAAPDVVGVATKDKAGGAKVLSMELNSAATTPSNTPPPPPTDQEEVAAEEVVAAPVVFKTEAELAKIAKANKKKREAKKRAAAKKAATLLNPPIPDASALSVQDEVRFSDID